MPSGPSSVVGDSKCPLTDNTSGNKSPDAKVNRSRPIAERNAKDMGVHTNISFMLFCPWANITIQPSHSTSAQSIPTHEGNGKHPRLDFSIARLWLITRSG
ncbi:hypothetical protein FRB95_009276 [Tulasnella sp. JGI-2019a]|nr:hypothetical protein FRB95_009276 [Tulasnella sp. JGI-2019a]